VIIRERDAARGPLPLLVNPTVDPWVRHDGRLPRAGLVSGRDEHPVKLAIIRRLREVNAEAGTGTVSYQAHRARFGRATGRLKELYVMGDMTKDEYTYKRQILEHELAALEPPVVNDAEEAAAALTNFTVFWEREQDAKKRNRLLRSIFQSVTASEGELVAVPLREAFLPYFAFEVGGREIRERRDSNPATSRVTGCAGGADLGRHRRSNALSSTA
jgi:hypothetical protein